MLDTDMDDVHFVRVCARFLKAYGFGQGGAVPLEIAGAV